VDKKALNPFFSNRLAGATAEGVGVAPAVPVLYQRSLTCRSSLVSQSKARFWGEVSQSIKLRVF
jgi:hypothetical protein